MTRSREARKRRDDRLAWVLLVAGATFVGASKWPRALDSARPHRLPLGAIPLDVSPLAPNPKPGAIKTGTRLDAPAIDLSFVDALIAKHGRGREAAIPILQAIQAHYRYLPDEALRRVCELTEVTPAQVAGTSSFYARFRRSPVGEHVVRVCHGTACHVAGARQITDELRRHLHIAPGQDTDPARQFTIDEVACLGCCSLAPVLMVDEHTAGRLSPATAAAALDMVREAEPV